MRSLLIGLLIGVSTIATADPRDWAKRIPCELQTAGVASLPTLEVLQGSSPLIACDQYRSGKALTVTNDVQAVMRFSSSLTNTLWVSVTNQSYYSNSYLIQLPSLGTNAVNWVYTILYYKDGAIYWTGTGRLDIKKTEVAGSALQFVQVVGCITTNDINSAISTHNTNLTSHATLLSSYVTQAMTNGWTVSAHLDWLVRSETNGWVVAPHEAWLTAEVDPTLAPALSALSNQVNTASVKATSSAGSTLNSLSGAECLRWGVGSSCAISTTDGLQVGGTLSANLFSGNGASLTNLPTSAITGLTAFQASAVTNGQAVVTFGNTNFQAQANGSCIFGTYGKAYVDFGEMTLGHKNLDDVPNKYAFSQTSGGTVAFNSHSECYFRLFNNTKFWYDASNLYISTVTASFAKPVTMASNLTVSGISRIILPTSTNGLASGTLWNNGGNVSQQGITSPLTFTNSTTLSDGALGGTNGVYFTRNGTNYWILLP